MYILILKFINIQIHPYASPQLGVSLYILIYRKHLRVAKDISIVLHVCALEKALPCDP